MKISIIIPVLNEAGCIEECLAGLQEMRQKGHEVVVVDGGSSDATVTLATPLCDSVVNSARGRARQMNAGAATAAGGVLLFLHADTRLTFDAGKLHNENVIDDMWGCFSVRLSGSQPLLRIIEFFINLRSRLTHIVSGDQVLFISRGLFNHVGGFPDIPLMEDIAISSTLKRCSAPRCLPDTVVTSSRRWERHGIIKTVLQMWLRRFRFAMGVSQVPG